MLSWLRALGGCAAELLYPSQANCMGCGAHTGADDHWLCADCAAKLEPLRKAGGARCPVCGRPGERARSCACARWPEGGLSLARYTYAYDVPVKGMVRRMKYAGVSRLCDWMAGEMAGMIREEPFGAFDLIVPVPLHEKRLRERGFNQAALLAEGIGRRLAAEVAPDAARRVRYTRQQAKLGAEKRRDNLEGAFTAGDFPLTGRHVLLVDDVLSTGQTAGWCALALRSAGAADVQLAALAGAGARKGERA